jgi:uncharacterized protein (TIGR02996 family)
VKRRGPTSNASADVQAKFIAEIIANPDDDGPRLVYADWLTQRGDPRGELIVTQCQLEAATGGERARLVNRASDLLYRQGTWLDEIKSVVRGVETRRGFVYSINASASVFAKRCGPWFEREPIEELRVIKPGARDLATLRKAAGLARLRTLVFLDPIRLTEEAHVTALSELLAVLRVRALELQLVVGDDVARATRGMMARISLPALESLKLRMRSTETPEIAGGLAKATLPGLRRLVVPRSAVDQLRTAFPQTAVAAIVDG